VPPPGPFDPDPIGPRRRPGRRAQIVLAAAAVLVIAGVTAFFVSQRDPDGNLVAGGPTSSVAASPAAASSPPPPTDCGANETFDSAELSAGWERTRPDVDVPLAGSAARMIAPDGSDIYDDRIDAPMLLRTVPGDFVMETTVAAEPDQFYQGAGLVILVDETHYVRVELGYGDVRAIVFEYRNGGAHTKVHPPRKRDPNVVVATQNDVVLQLERSGNEVTARWRSGEQTKLRNLGTITVDLPDTVKAGVSVLNRAQSGAEPEPFPATFYRVWFTC
jgi:regulation of enolase protein 1 (concanavalin A-like superfamily)